MTEQKPNLSDDKQVLDYDPLSKLHKMSTTAGLGSGDYVAVNIVAVVTALLGVASILAKLNNALLVIPIVGILCGVIAIMQIGRSNGTQTGRGLAIVGLLLSLGFGGFVIVQQITDYYRTQQDQKEIAALIAELGERIKAKDYAKAYDLFDSNFQDAVSAEKFKSRLSFFETAQAMELYGGMKNMEWNGRLVFDTDTRTGSMIAGGVALMNFDKKGEPSRQAAYFRKIGSKWKVDALPDLFPAEKPAGAPGGPPSPGGPAGPAGPGGPGGPAGPGGQ